MSKASRGVASVTQQSGKEFHSLGSSTENARRPHEFRRYRRHDELMTTGEE